MSCQIKLRRLNTSTPWGFRMNGGAEHGQPLYIQKVTASSMAARAGLMPGDGILAIGMADTAHMTHNQGKMEIIRAGNDVDFIIQRNVVPVKTADDADPGSPRADVVDESWRSNSIPAQDPNVQSRSFKMLQQQLAAE